MSTTGGRASRRRGSDALRIFLEYLEEIDHAVLARDAMRITALLRKRTATHLPREVREDLLAFSGRPRDGFRAPVQFLRFQHRMVQLAQGGERMLTAQRELAIDGSLASAAGPIVVSGAARRRNGERRSAASKPAKPAKPAGDDEPSTDSPTRRER